MTTPLLIRQTMPGSHGEHDLQERYGTRSRAEAFYKHQMLSYLNAQMRTFIVRQAAGMTALGMGNGAVFQLVAQRFPEKIGVITGIVGAAGGLGGFVLPNALGSLKQLTQSYGGGFLAFALVGASGAVVLVFVGRTWEASSNIRKNRRTGRKHRQETGELPPYHSLRGTKGGE